mmetsp:Transcript_57926/g.180011  ORF Transcript_57926/g.180011 Transcript_57926/m.180011 type:complete len:205 (+) Transcript_57926:641-1255(+)
MCTPTAGFPRRCARTRCSGASASPAPCTSKTLCARPSRRVSAIHACSPRRRSSSRTRSSRTSSGARASTASPTASSSCQACWRPSARTTASMPSTRAPSRVSPITTTLTTTTRWRRGSPSSCAATPRQCSGRASFLGCPPTSTSMGTAPRTMASLIAAAAHQWRSPRPLAAAGAVAERTGACMLGGGRACKVPWGLATQAPGTL